MSFKRLNTITGRESQIIELLVNEFSTKEIARELNISFETVKTHRNNIRIKLGVKNVAGVVREAFYLKLVG